ncbi:unnamed protein product, partial [Leptidea sinapis]
SSLVKCKENDSKCLIHSVQAFLPTFAVGLPEFQIAPLDPVTLIKINASTPDLSLLLENVKVTGLKECQVKKFDYNVKNSKVLATFLCNVNAVGHYNMKGKLIIVPIEGDGQFDAKIKKLAVIVDADVSTIQKNGVKYFNIKNWKHRFELKDKTSVHFENLFNGNKVLAQAADEIIKETGNEIIEELCPSIIKGIHKLLMKLLRRREMR